MIHIYIPMSQVEGEQILGHCDLCSHFGRHFCFSLFISVVIT